MSMDYLGETLDIHCGGIDHIPVHNTNEIAQSECATGHVFARFWVHGAFLTLATGAVTGRNAAEKMSKSSGDFLTVQKLIDDGFDPLAYRYLCLTAHYRSELAFSYDSLGAATKALGKIYELRARMGERGDALSRPGVRDDAPGHRRRHQRRPEHPQGRRHSAPGQLLPPVARVRPDPGPGHRGPLPRRTPGPRHGGAARRHRRPRPPARPGPQGPRLRPLRRPAQRDRVPRLHRRRLPRRHRRQEELAVEELHRHAPNSSRRPSPAWHSAVPPPCTPTPPPTPAGPSRRPTTPPAPPPRARTPPERWRTSRPTPSAVDTKGHATPIAQERQTATRLFAAAQPSRPAPPSRSSPWTAPARPRRRSRSTRLTLAEPADPAAGQLSWTTRRATSGSRRPRAGGRNAPPT